MRAQGAAVEIRGCEAPGPEAPTDLPGLLIVNADDWGFDVYTTDRILECWQVRALSSVSAMVFMQDSVRAAGIALEHGVEVGLHLNLTTVLTGEGVSPALADHQERVARHLTRHRLAQAVFHPGLMRSFEYVAAAQIDEFARLYGEVPRRLDGHHHMHLSANVIMQKLLPAGTFVRRNFSLEGADRSAANHLYRKWVDGRLARNHRLTDYFFSLPPLEPASRLDKIFSLAKRSAVEVETHPVNADEYRFLVAGGLLRQIGDVCIARPSDVRRFREKDA